MPVNWYIISIDRCAHRGWATLLLNQTSYNIASWKRWGLFRVSYRNYFPNKSIHAWYIEYIAPITIFVLVTYNGGALATNSNAKIPNEVTLAAEKNVTSSLWVFQELKSPDSNSLQRELSLQSDYLAILRLGINMVRSIPNIRITSNTGQITGESIIKYRFCGTKSWHCRLPMAFCTFTSKATLSNRWPKFWTRYSKFI
jgi:hypothetical protein